MIEFIIIIIHIKYKLIKDIYTIQLIIIEF